MAREFEFSAGVNKLAPGFTVIVKPIEVSTGNAGSVARHETDHALVAHLTGTPVIEASIIPGPGYLGITKVAGFNAMSAAAAHSMGRDGTGYDVSLVHHMGHDVGSAASAARSILSHNMDRHAAVASLLQAKGTITGSDIERVIRRVDNPEAEVVIISPSGTKRHFVSKAREADGYTIPIEITLEKPVKAENPNNWPKLEVGRVDVPINDRPLVEKIHTVPNKLEKFPLN